MQCHVQYVRPKLTGCCLCPGYAVTAGHFSSPNVIDVAAGAPQHGGSGKVIVFSAGELKASCVVCYSGFVFSCTGLHFQNRWCVFGEELSSLRENGMSLNVVICTDAL